MKGEIGFWLGVFILALAFVALCWAIWLEVKQSPIVYFKCCDHCFTQDGEYVGFDHPVDNHHAPCMENYCITGQTEHYA